MSGLNVPGSDATSATQDLIKTQTDKVPRLISGAIEILEDTGTTLPALLERIQSGTIEILDSVGNQTSGSIARVQSGVIEILDDTGVTLPASLARIQSGAIEVLDDTGVVIPASISRLQSGVIEILNDTMSSIPSLITDVRKTVYGSEVVASGIQLTGSAWLNVCTVNPVQHPTSIAAVKFATSGDIIGTAKYRIVDNGDVKLFPHVDENVLTSGSEDIFTHTVDVPNSNGYKVQVRTTSVDDTSGKTVSLSQLSKIELH
jgi:hypothetical protein